MYRQVELRMLLLAAEVLAIYLLSLTQGCLEVAAECGAVPVAWVTVVAHHFPFQTLFGLHWMLLTQAVLGYMYLQPSSYQPHRALEFLSLVTEAGPPCKVLVDRAG